MSHFSVGAPADAARGGVFDVAACAGDLLIGAAVTSLFRIETTGIILEAVGG